MIKTPTGRPLYLFACLILLILFSCSGKKEGAVYSWRPAKGSHIVILGNTFAERLQHYNYFETLLIKSFPDQQLTVRDLGWSADEVNLQPRPLNFGSLDEHLALQKADII